MTPVRDRVRRPKQAPSPEQVVGLKAWLARIVADPVDVRRLDDGELRKLLELAEATNVGPHGTNMRLLDRAQTRTFEKVIEKAAGLPAGELGRRRDEARTAARFAALARTAARPAQPRAGEEKALLTLLHDHVRDGFLHIGHLSIYAYVLGQLLSAEALSPGSRIEGSGDGIVLVIDGARGFGLRYDPDGDAIGGWKKSLEHLAANEWLSVERSGQLFRVGFGLRTLEALR